MIRSDIAYAIAVSASLLASAPALAASCWDHNGSVMRLEASGNQRWIYYEEPRDVLWDAGVRQGTLLFEGTNNNGWYSGQSRVFSKYCPGNPQIYAVEGPVSDGQRRITLEGTRDKNRQCSPTGQTVHDVLVFTYLYDC